MYEIIKLKKEGKRMVSLFLSAILTVLIFFPYLPPTQVKAANFGDTVTLTSAHGDFGSDHKLYCIDKGGLAIWGIADDGDVYENHRPTEAAVPLSKKEQEYIFWGILTLEASLGQKKANDVIAEINVNAQKQGKKQINRLVSEEDLKALIYSSHIRDKYSWLETVASNTEAYLKMAGLIGGSGGSTRSGKKVPAVIANSTSLLTAYQISRADFTIHFDEGGADAEFIQKVPIMFSNNNGTSYNAVPTDGWTYTKTSNSITFLNPNPMPPKALLKFEVAGTEYETTGGAYASEEILFDECMQIWECTSCSGNHGGGTPPTSEPWVHQRMVWLEIGTVPIEFYAALAGDPAMSPDGGEITFQVFRHAEDFTSAYNTQLYKYDHETGKPLESARFVLYERFDDKGEIDTNRDGSIHIYEGGEPYASFHTDNPVLWDGFRKAGSVVTDSNGHASQRIEHGYHYDKTFCDGHPAPVFVPVPEPEMGEEDETTGESGEILNSAQIEEAKTQNRQLARAWLDCTAACEEQAGGKFEGVHFHWLMSDVDQGEIENIASTGGEQGSTPNGGNTSEPEADTAYEESGCHQDMQDTYDKFISLKYSYAYTEYQARNGYIRHDLHAEDPPVEVIMTDASENGANASFAEMYSNKESLETGMKGYIKDLDICNRENPLVVKEKGIEKSKVLDLPKRLFKKAETAVQKIIPYKAREAGNAIKEAVDQITGQDTGQVSKINVDQGEDTNTVRDENTALQKKATDSETTEASPPAEISSRSQEQVSSFYGKAASASSAFEFIDEDKKEKEIRNIVENKKPPASPSEASFKWLRSGFSFRSPDMRTDEDDMTEDLFAPAYEDAMETESVGEAVKTGPDNSYSHCNHTDGEGETWRIYDHRTEGEFHINKKDLDLASGDAKKYSAYGDTQGDSSLEGAVYGLFAMENIEHPDGKTGIVYKADNLIAIATTDKNGDASFLANTEAPGYTYDYEKGAVTKTDGGWAADAPKNLYVADRFFDDYTEDRNHVRNYQNNEQNNGNCWIGRPLLMGDYYIKEVSRSEGYELSIGERQNDITNRDQDPAEEAPEAAAGYALISRPLYADEQTSDDGSGSGPNELFFTARSKDTKDQKYDLVLPELPEGVEFYRKETGSKAVEAQVGTGIYEKVYLMNPDGTPKYIRAENDYQYLRYNAVGSMMTKQVSVNFIAERFRQAVIRTIDADTVQAVLNRADGSMTEEENGEILLKPFTEGNLLFVKGKVEAILRKNGKLTPKSVIRSGHNDYSSIYAGVFDSGVRKGDKDMYGLSGVTPGNPAAYTVYGSPIQKVSVVRKREDGTTLTVGDAILTILNQYEDNPYYSFGGIDGVEEIGGDFVFTVYEGISGNPDNFMVLGSDPKMDSIIYHGIKYIPKTALEAPRLVYASYSNNSAYHAFGAYEDYRQGNSGASVIGRATLITDAVVDEHGNLQSKMTEENIYYQTGELARDANGNLMQAFEYRELTETKEQEIEEVKWKKIPAVRQKTSAAKEKNSNYVITVDAAYEDAFGVLHGNSGQDQTVEFKAVLKEKEVILTEEEAKRLGAGFIGGRPMDSASYYVHVKMARVKAYLSYLNMNLIGDNTYVVMRGLIYPGQETIYQDAGTREKPIQVFERVIRQKVKILKDIETMPDGAYAYNTNAGSGHEDRFTAGPGGVKDDATKLHNFRFKTYLKSNLERLYRNDAGSVTWIDRDGKDADIEEYRRRYPEKELFGRVEKFYTEVLHKADSKTAGSISNNVWEEAIIANKALYSHDETGVISDAQNEGYTRLLETITESVEYGTGKKRAIEGYNYEKFFSAIQVANHDKWDGKEEASTSFKPFSSIRALVFGAGSEKERYPAVHQNEKTENLANTSALAKENAAASDTVRQFAIDWYLDDEVIKLTEDNGHGEVQTSGGDEAYQEETYDKALREAIMKGRNYLKPFFNNNLDEIYAVEWDDMENGGADQDKTTLSADTLYLAAGNERDGKAEIKPENKSGIERDTSKNGYFYGVSKYLPYGTYITVEQQPSSAELGDLYNKHYRIDHPKEIVLPSVYEVGKDISAPEMMDQFYQYNSSDTPEELQKKYHIRFNEEWGNGWGKSHKDDLRGYVIRAHNNDGDYEIYKYGLEPDKLEGTITYPSGAYTYQGFSVAQETGDPYKDVYEGENVASRYKINDDVEQYYQYASLSEDARIANNVLYQHEFAMDDNSPSGFYFRDDVKTMTGSQTAFDGRYASALVPWTVAEPVDAGIYDSALFTGYAEGRYQNTFYASKLRIEKLDSETGENILHDGAVFTLYSAKRDDGEHTDGLVRFYDRDTVVAGSKEFLEAMGAKDITPLSRTSPGISLPWQIPYMGRYYGTLSAGSPICEEKEQIFMEDETGKKTGHFHAFTTTKDIALPQGFDDQNIGYLTTPQPLGAGCYVLAEIKSPSGYVRSKPVAIEIYSDQVDYYLDGNKDKRVAAAIYGSNKNKSKENGDVATVYLNNIPIRLEVTKAKSDEKEVNYELNGRLEGSITELKSRYGLENMEMAYNGSGFYLGYGWRKGFLDSLKQKQAAGERIEILYVDGIFTGKAKLYKTLKTAGDVNRYLPGAVMTLYDAVEIRKNGDSEDVQFDGVNVVRDRYGNVKNIYVQKGYAGKDLKYILDRGDPDGPEELDYQKYTYNDQEDDKGTGTWIGKTVEREDTDILFYDLGGLKVLDAEKGVLYCHDRDGNKIMASKGNGIFAFKNGIPFLEIICDDYKNLHYSSKNRLFDKVPVGTRMYHLDSDKNRDCLVNPYTGMAYTIEEGTKRILVWPVKISVDQYGNAIAREKIGTGRIAEIESDTADAYTIGTYGSVTFDGRSRRLKKSVNPVLNEHGQPEYYQRSDEIYKKGEPVYDRDGDFVRYRYDVQLKNYNDNAYVVDNNADLQDVGADLKAAGDDKPLNHRQGEAYLIKNTWVTGDKTPNDPFSEQMTDGQVDVLKRVAAGHYIMEELKAPEGYVKTMPVGLTVSDSTEVWTAKATDRAISGYIEKMDAPAAYEIRILDRDSVFDEERKITEGKGSYTYQNVLGAELALYRAKRVTDTDLKRHPSGYYLIKAEDTPAVWNRLDSHNRKIAFTAKWITGMAPEYLENIPKGDYILDELHVPDGYVRSSMEIEIKETAALQYFTLPNDHTKVEIFKYEEKEGKKSALGNEHAAELSLYEAEFNDDGIIFEAGIPRYDSSKMAARWTTDDCRRYSEGKNSFVNSYEKMFKEYRNSFSTFTWNDGMQEIKSERIQEDATDKNESVRQLWKLSSGKQVLVQATKNLQPTGKSGYSFDYKFNYEILAGDMAGYDTAEGMHRIDYLPFNGISKDGSKKGFYCLVETKSPVGYAMEKPKAVVIEETADVQLYALKNEPNYIYVNKVSADKKQISGVELALYRTADGGILIMDEPHLADRWVSGAEGIYTADDYEDGRIPEGFKAGDLKPHRLSPIPYGTYYLVELKTLAGYQKMKPKKIELGSGTNPFIEAVNSLKQGRLILQKTDDRNTERKLFGAVFEVENRDTKEHFKLVTDENGRVESGLFATGKTGEKGNWIPYHFTIKELIPPMTYQLNLTSYEFSFSENAHPEDIRSHDGHLDGNDSGEENALKTLEYRLSVPNKQTEISITKSDFNTGLFVKGAILAVYAVKMVDGKCESDGDAIETWLTDGETHIIRGKLSAGHVYLLRELKSPHGYNKSGPMIFTLSDDGRRIVNVTGDRNQVEFKTSGSFIDAVESVTILGRQATAVTFLLTDLDGAGSGKTGSAGNTIIIPAWQNRPLGVIDGLVEGHRYEQKEITDYTDGNRRVSSRTVFRLHFNEAGTYLPSVREAETTNLKIEEGIGDLSGDLIEEWEVKNHNNSGYAHTIFNPEYEDKQNIQVISASGRYGAGVMAGSIIKYEITYHNDSVRNNEQERGQYGRQTDHEKDHENDHKKDILITAKLDFRTTYMAGASTGNGREENGIVSFVVRNVEPGETGSLILAVKVSDTTQTDAPEPSLRTIETCTSIDGRNYSFTNPIVTEGSLTISTKAGGTAAEELEQMESNYTAILLDGNGDPLKGLYSYSALKNGGIKNGRIRSGESILLKAGETVTITGMAWGSKYQIRKEGEDREGVEETAKGVDGVTGKQGACAVFLYRKNDVSVREVFRKNETYRLTETTVYSDGEKQVSQRLSFTLGEQAFVDGLDVKDRPTHVIITKTDIVGEKELPGAHLTIINQEGTVIDEWISTDEPHRLEAVLEPGETYFLTEINPPDGYAFAEMMEFTVSLDGTVDRVHMTDQSTDAVVLKVGFTGRQKLKGAFLEVKDETGTVVERWISDGTEHRITGKLIAGATYTLTETIPPAGYYKAESITFTVSKDGTADQVLMKDSETKVKIEKRGASSDGKTDLGIIGGARIQIRDKTGILVYQFFSKEGISHDITGILTAGESYIAEEAEAPDGFLQAEPVEFSVPEDAGLITVVMKDRRMPEKPPDKGDKDRPKLHIKKYDKETFESLPGAEFIIYGPDGIFFQRIVTDKNGRATIDRPPAGIYTMAEVKAPPGYMLSYLEYKFIVSRSGIISGDTAVSNEKQPALIGAITAKYDTKLRGIGKALVKGGKKVRIPAAGDSSGGTGGLVLIFVLSVGLLFVLFIIHRKKGRRGSKADGKRAESGAKRLYKSKRRR